ncbi:MAG TPA: TonB family protein [Gemmatimonadales bacterium]|nr:TonB family protein [Gemmatimonadales bacterium]
MLDVLIASAAHPQVRAHWLTTATATHVLVIALAVSATKGALDQRPLVPADAAILLYVPKPPAPPPPEAPKPAVDLVRLNAAPPPKGFQTVVAPVDMPAVIPPIDLHQRPLDPRDFTGRGVEGGVASGVVGGTGPVVQDAETLTGIYEASSQLEGFVQAVLVKAAAPAYPAALAAVGIEGRVSTEFVIDTTGRVEQGSIRILDSTHPAFETSARTAVAAALFQPARFGARPVRQLTRQAIRFVAAH